MTTRTVYARRTKILPIAHSVANEFLEAHHRAGATAEQGKSLVSIGLFEAEELLAVIQFCTPRTARKKKAYTVELLRLAFKTDVRVIGGASKLIKYYRTNYNPADFFTYQDTSGESTAVYEHAGMTLVSAAKTKSYLVAPGKSLATANRKETLGLAYATRFGPDRILGTKLGEVLRSDGSRKSNLELFVEELGWSLEETTGDRVYEWINPELTFYTYKITASDSDKYYYGVSHVKQANASFEVCLSDGYYGTGGTGVYAKTNKFSNWKRKHATQLQKEIIATFSRKAEAYEHEASLVGDKYKTDKLCLNSTAGGKTGGLNAKLRSTLTKNCAIHGDTTFQGSTCMRCSAERHTTVEACSIHGETKHRGGVCSKCSIRKLFSESECAVHGLTVFRGGGCAKCLEAKHTAQDSCGVHGVTTFRRGVCLKCKVSRALSTKLCTVHGDVLHNGDTCISCSNQAVVTVKACSIHGETKHQGTTCSKCSRERTMTERVCVTHGLTKHVGDTCSTCVNQKTVTLKACPVHGETKHQGEKCGKCVAAAKVGLRDCPTHGLVKHNGRSCFTCMSDRRKAKRLATA